MFRAPLLAHPLSRLLFPDVFYPVDDDERQFGMKLRATRLLRYKETLKLPRGWNVIHLPEPVAIDSPAVSLTFEAAAGDGMLTYEFELALKKHIVPPEDYPEFKKALDAVRMLSEEWFVCTVNEPASEQAAVR